MDVKRKRVLFLLPSMRGGGSERVISIIVNHLDRSVFEPVLVLLQKEGIYLNDLPKDLKIVDLKVTKARYAIGKIVKTIQMLEPDIVMSTLGHINILLALLKPLLPKKTKYIARESSIVSINNQQTRYPALFDFLYKRVFNNFHGIIAQSQFMKQDLVENYGVNAEKIRTIYNPLDIAKIEQLSQEECNCFNSSKFNILIVGRLSNEKNHKAIFHIMKLLPKEYHLTVLGDGILKEELLELSQTLELQEQVSFIGFDKNPYKYMKQADVVVSMSFYEGFPNVLIEATACTTPIVAYNGKGGTAEIIENGVNGYLIPFGDEQAFCRTLEKMKEHNLEEQSIKERALQYEVSKIIQQYEKTFLDTLGK